MHDLAPIRAEEVDCVYLGEARPKLCNARSGGGSRISGRLASESLCKFAHFLRDLGVIGVARALEERPDLAVRHAIDEASLQHHRLAPAVLDLAQKPLQVLVGLPGEGQRV